jgi:hypothetical protein
MLDWSRTVHGIGDLHAGAISQARLTTVIDDVTKLGEAPALHLQIGDATENGTPREDEIAKRWLGRLPGPYRTVLGNHDIFRNRRTAAQWARAYGSSAKNFTEDLGFARVIAIGPDRMPQTKEGVFSKATRDWLEAELEAAAGQDCWIACHWPPYGTVGGDPKRYYHSKLKTFHAKPHEPIRSLLARHPNAKVWLSGHTHSPVWAPGVVSRFRLPRGRWILAVNLSALVGVGKTRDPTDPLCSVYLTHRDDHIELRYRDHARGYWGAFDGPGYMVAGVPGH